MTLNVTLVDGSYSVDLNGGSWTTDPFFIRELDLGFPAPREVVQDAPSQDGQSDYTTLFGGRTITARLYVRPGAYSINYQLDVLRSLCAPNKRLTMLIARDGWEGVRQVVVRGSAYACMINKVSNIYAEVDVSWTAPLGAFEATSLTSYDTFSNFESTGLPITSGSPGSTALPVVSGDMDVTGNADLGDEAIFTLSGTAANVQNITNPGTLPVAPTFVIQGPCTNPKIIDVSHRQRMSFVMTVNNGAQVIVDTANRKITYLGATGHQYVDWSASRWLTFPSGVTQVMFDTDSSGPGCVLTSTFRPRYA